MRFLNRLLPGLLLALFVAQAAIAQQTESLSPSVVLVLKLVSATHVRPVTGVVVSDTGLVLVPADFVSLEGEIVVLDGGTDILSHGRPAKIVNRSIAGDLAVLLVDGLNRPVITLSETDSNNESNLHLEAFPPAQYIARGAEPLLLPVNIVRDNSTGKISISAETPLPYVTGALMDHCGHLTGLSLARGAQNLDTDISPVTMFADELVPVLESMQITLPVAKCVIPVQHLDATPGSSDDRNITLETPEQEETAQPGEAVEPVEDEILMPITDEPATDTRQGAAIEPAMPAPLSIAERPALWRSVPPWLGVAGLIILALGVWKLVFVLRAGKYRSGPVAFVSGESSLQPASDEPDTIQLQAGSDNSAPAPRSGYVDEAVLPDMNDLPEGYNATVMIEGQLDAETSFRRFCMVDADQLDIVIGRGKADICIEHPAISRAHARFECHGESMTLSDMGSSNGTFINAVPCLPGEIMFVGPDDEIFLGDVRFSISLLRKGVEF